METILSRSVSNTRPRDFYDIYILEKGQTFDAKVFQEALRATSEHRGSWERIKDYDPIIEQIENSDVLKRLWKKYRDTFFYAREITFEDTIAAIRKVLA